LVNGIPKQFKNVEEIMHEFYNYRMALYEKRYKYLIGSIESEIAEMEKKLKIARLFIEQKVNTNDEDLYEKIKEYTDLTDEDINKFFETNNILTIVKIARSSEKGLKKIELDIEKMRAELDQLKEKTPKELWLEDLENL